MTKVFALLIAGSILIGSVPAHACRQLVSSVKTRLSDVVIIGEAQCLETSGNCQLYVRKVLKGRDQVKASRIEIAVTDAPKPRDDGTLIISRCPQTFEPRQKVIAGRFYLVVREDGSFFAAHPIDVDEDVNIETVELEPIEIQ